MRSGRRRAAYASKTGGTAVATVWPGGRSPIEATSEALPARQDRRSLRTSTGADAHDGGRTTVDGATPGSASSVMPLLPSPAADVRPMVAGQQSLAACFDDWYADMVGSPTKDEIAQRHLGLPVHLLSTSPLGWEGVAEDRDRRAGSPSS